MAFQDIVPPVLIATLRDNLPPLDSALLEQYQQIQERNHGALLSRLSEHYGGMSLDIAALKLQLQDSTTIQQRTQRYIQGESLGPENSACTKDFASESRFSLIFISPKT